MRAQANAETKTLRKSTKFFQVITTKKIRRLRDAVEERATAFGVVGLRCHDFLGFDER